MKEPTPDSSTIEYELKFSNIKYKRSILPHLPRQPTSRRPFFQAGLLGGKGGFGSLLRSIKAKSTPTTNFTAMRDLTTGRRLGLVEQQKRVAQWRQKREEEDEFVQKEMEKWEREGKGWVDEKKRRRKLDHKFVQLLRENEESIIEAIE